MTIMSRMRSLALIVCAVLATAMPAQGYELEGGVWGGGRATYYVDIPGASGLWNSAFVEAVGLWNQATPYFQFDVVLGVFKEPCDDPLVVTPRNGVKFSATVCGVAYGTNVLAVAMNWTTVDHRFIRQSGIWFDTSNYWNVYHGPTATGENGVYDFRRTAVHELGHSLGLAHEEDVPSMMHEIISDLEVPTVDDKAGVKFLYESTPPLGSDLVIENVSVTPLSAGTSASRTITYRIANRGNVTAAPSRTNVRLSSSSTNVTTADLLLTSFDETSIPTDGAFIHTISTQLPAGLSGGTYHLWVIADVASTAGQFDENNDRAHTPLVVGGAPAVSSVSPANMVADGQSHALTILGSDFQAENVVQFKWAVGLGSGTWNMGNAPSLTSAGQMTVNMNPGLVNDTIYVRVCRSASATTTADCSSGNHSVFVVAIGHAADLVVSNLTVVPASAGSSAQRTIQYTVRNQGFASSAPSTTNIRLSASDTNVTTSDTLLTSFAEPSIAVGSGLTHTMTLSLPGVRAGGTYHVWAIADVGSTAGQFDESNDRVHTPLIIGAAPTVASVSPTGMVADGLSHALSISGSDFQADNVVQFKWSSGAGSGAWNTGSAPTVSSAGQMTVSMNPGTVNDTINVRVCRSAGATTVADCSSGTHGVAVASQGPPVVSAVNPTSMPADGASRVLSISGSGFAVGNQVQFKYSGSGGWVKSLGVPSITANLISLSMNPGTVADVIYVRVCKSGSATSSTDCSSGAHSVTVTPPVRLPVPVVGSVSPAVMPGDGLVHVLTIYGGNFSAGNQVQYSYTGSGGWANSAGTPSVTATRISLSINPGTSNDSIFVRVCRSASEVAATDCSPQAVSVRVSLPCPAATSVVGTVIDGATRAGKSGATVRLGESLLATTSSTGAFSFTGVPAGLYRLAALAPGYAEVGQALNVCNSTSIVLEIAAASTVNGLSSNSGYAADPVNTATGNYTFQRTDLKWPSKGHGTAFERGYNSYSPVDGPLGFGWTHNFVTSLTALGNGYAVIRWGDGKTQTYISNGEGGFTAQYGVFDKLTAAAGGWLLTQRSGRHLGFDGSGRLTSVSDRNGNTQVLAYASGRLTQVTDTAGRNLVFTYDGNGRITQLADPLGRTIQFAYDAMGNLISSTDPAGRVTSYTYDANHQMLTATDPRGHVFVSNTYDPGTGVVIAQHDAKGGQTSYSYDLISRLTTITDPQGRTSVHRHDSLLRLVEEEDGLGHVRRYEYDALGNRVGVTDRNGNVTPYEYDVAGNVTKKTDALGRVTTASYDGYNNPLTRTDALGQVTSFVYDGQGNLLTVTDALGHTGSTTYNAAGQPLTRTDARGKVTSYAYDAAGNLVQVTDALGQVTGYAYDAVGRQVSRTDALGRVTTFGYDAADNLLTVTDPAGHAESYGYDGNNNRVTVTDRLGRVTTTAYDVKDLPTTVTNALGGVVATAYDALDRRTQLTDPRGQVTQFAYDAGGRLTATNNALGQGTQYVYDAHGNRTGVIDALGHSSALAYDALHRLVQSTDAVGGISTTGYDAVGRVTNRTNAKGQVTALQYDAVGRLLKVTDAAGGVVSFTYDANGNRLTQTDPRGSVTSYAYDNLNRLVQKTDPGGYVTQYAYDAVGNRTQVSKPNGTVLSYTYDVLDRLTRVTYPNGTQVNFTYDAKGNRLTLVDGMGTTTYTYDALDRLTSRTDPFAKTVSYQYDVASNLMALGYPDGKQVTYTYDSLNRLAGLTDWAGRQVSYGYDAAGRLTGAALPNGTQATYGYDPADRLTALSHRVGAAAPFASYAYVLDPLGNHTQVTATEPLQPTLSQSTTSYTYDVDNRLTNVGGTAQSFDPDGNLTASGTRSFAWDFEDRLLQGTVAGSTQTYQYDGVGNRLTRTAAGATTRFVLDSQGPLARVLAETNTAGLIGAYYVYGLGLVARVGSDGSARYYHHDSRGSTVALTDSAGTVTDKYAYDPFGTNTNSQGATTNAFRYVGRHGLMDEGNGLLYVRARYYDPGQGRFLSKDPLPGSDADSQSLHRFVYATNNPVRLVDLSGLSAAEGSIQQRSSMSSDIAHNLLVTNSGSQLATAFAAGSNRSRAGLAQRRTYYPGTVPWGRANEVSVCVVGCLSYEWGATGTGNEYNKLKTELGARAGFGYVHWWTTGEPSAGWDGNAKLSVDATGANIFGVPVEGLSIDSSLKVRADTGLGMLHVESNMRDGASRVGLGPNWKWGGSLGDLSFTWEDGKAWDTLGAQGGDWLYSNFHGTTMGDAFGF